MTKISKSDYNNIQTIVAGILGTSNTGYGQLVQSSQVSQGSKSSATTWNLLWYDLASIYLHQTGNALTTTTLPKVNKGDYIANSSTTTRAKTDIPEVTFLALANTLSTNRTTANFNQTSSTSPITQSLTWPSPSLGASWSYELLCNGTITFTSTIAVNYFFNAGGQFVFSSTRSGGTSNSQNSAWTTLLNSGTLVINASSFANLTSNTSTVNSLGTVSTSTNYFQLSASYDGNVTITFSLKWFNGVGSNIDGTTTVNVSSVYPYSAAGILLASGGSQPFSLYSSGSNISSVYTISLPTGSFGVGFNETILGLNTTGNLINQNVSFNITKGKPNAPYIINITGAGATTLTGSLDTSGNATITFLSSSAGQSNVSLYFNYSPTNYPSSAPATGTIGWVPPLSISLSPSSFTGGAQIINGTANVSLGTLTITNTNSGYGNVNISITGGATFTTIGGIVSNQMTSQTYINLWANSSISTAINYSGSSLYANGTITVTPVEHTGTAYTPYTASWSVTNYCYETISYGSSSITLTNSNQILLDLTGNTLYAGTGSINVSIAQALPGSTTSGTLAGTILSSGNNTFTITNSSTGIRNDTIAFTTGHNALIKTNWSLPPLVVSFHGATTNSTNLTGTLQPQVYSAQSVTTGSYTTTGNGTVSLSFSGVPSGLVVGFNNTTTQTLSIPITTDPSSFNITLSYYHTGMSAGNYSFNVISNGGTQSTTFTVYFTISYNPTVSILESPPYYSGTLYHISVKGGIPYATYSLDTAGSAIWYTNNGTQTLNQFGMSNSLTIQSISTNAISIYQILYIDMSGNAYTVNGGLFTINPLYTINFSNSNLNIVESSLGHNTYSVNFYFTPATTSIGTSDIISYQFLIQDSIGGILINSVYVPPNSYWTLPYNVTNGQSIYYIFSVTASSVNATQVTAVQVFHP